MKINVREHWRGNQKWTILRNWQHRSGQSWETGNKTQDEDKQTKYVLGVMFRCPFKSNLSWPMQHCFILRTEYVFLVTYTLHHVNSQKHFFFAISIQIIKLYILSINVAATLHTCHILNCWVNYRKSKKVCLASRCYDYSEITKKI
jgi:hypothetical protein